MAVFPRLPLSKRLRSIRFDANSRVRLSRKSPKSTGDQTDPLWQLALAVTKGRYPLQVLVRGNDIDQALRVLKKKMQREGIFREMKQRWSYEKPSERKNREKSEAIRRARKLARKKAQREGLIPDTRKKKLPDVKKAGQRPGYGPPRSI